MMIPVLLDRYLQPYMRLIEAVTDTAFPSGSKHKLHLGQLVESTLEKILAQNLNLYYLSVEIQS